jgi:hypothetical protein
VAVSVVHTDKGRLTTCLADDRGSTVMCVFDEKGLGSVCFPSGNPRLVVTKAGWSLSEEGGDILQSGTWPNHPPVSPIELQITECFSARFLGRRENKISFSYGGEQHVFECGEQLKRTDTYLDHVVSRRDGRLELDVDAIRAGPQHVYSKPGPHSQVTIHPGLGALKTICKNLDKGSPFQEIISSMDEMQASVLRMRGSTGSASTSTFSDTGAMAALRASQGEPGVSSLGNTLDSTTALGSTLASTSGGSTLTMRRPAPKPYQSKRKALRSIPVSGFDAHMASSSSPDTISVICCMADWQPRCRKAMPVLKSLNYDLQRSDGLKEKFAPLTVDMVQMNVSEDSSFMKRFNIRMIPMYLVCHKGRLVHASNAMSLRADFLKELETAVEQAKRGAFMPEKFQFKATDNNLLQEFQSGKIFK